jgi:hypothetical protein
VLSDGTLGDDRNVLHPQSVLCNTGSQQLLFCVSQTYVNLFLKKKCRVFKVYFIQHCLQWVAQYIKFKQCQRSKQWSFEHLHYHTSQMYQLTTCRVTSQPMNYLLTFLFMDEALEAQKDSDEAQEMM